MAISRNRSTPFEDLLGKVFDGAQDGLRESLTPEEYERRRHDFVFHLAEIREDVAKLSELLARPGELDEEAASTLLIGILYHTVPHLNAAGRLLLDHINDPFAE
jgi:hypothetical protein